MQTKGEFFTLGIVTLITLINMKENIVSIPAHEGLRILQLTDMQIIDSSQCRRPDRLCQREMEKWSPEFVEKNCYYHIRDLVAQTAPHLIIVTGDIVYGEFDDSGRILKGFVAFMESLGIPWAPVFGNHDKESRIGIEGITEIFQSSPNCLFRTETEEHEDGEGNYAVKIYRGDELIEMVYMLDTKGCTRSTDQSLRRPAGITEGQCRLMERYAEDARAEKGKTVPAILAYHIPTAEFFQAFEEKGYPFKEGFVLGATVEAQKGDFGAYLEKDHGFAASPENFLRRLQECGVRGVFTGHDHMVNTSVVWRDIRWTFGLKTGTYDYHTNGSLGGTLVEIENGELTVRHVPTLVGY